jgi:hypothetical protein
MQENQHGGVVKILANLGVTAPTEGRQKINGAGNM